MYHDHDAFELIADIEQRISTLPYGDSYAVYELLYDAASRVCDLGCFYVCLYAAENESLHFPYNRDGDFLEEPITLPLGEGPTSWVIRNQRPFILTEANETIQRCGVTFGSDSRLSLSAMHLPMRTVGQEGRRCLVGVMSAQSYKPDAFSPHAVCLLQGLADRAARILHQDMGHDDCKRRIAALEQEMERRHETATAIAEEFLAMMTPLAYQARALLAMTPMEMTGLRAAENEVYRGCHRVLTFIGEAPVHLHDIHGTPNTATSHHEGSGLTERELEIAALLKAGNTNAAIAERLFISADTVKFHCANLYRKLGVGNRVQAVQAAEKLLGDRPN